MRIEYHFDFGSPNCHLVHLAMPGFEARTGVRVDYVPILLGGLFKATGNVAPMQAFAGVPAKLAQMQRETARFVTRYGITDYRWNPDFPINTLALMRGATYARDKPWFMDYVDAMSRCMWAEPRKMDDPAVIAAALAENGLPAEEILAGAQTPEVKAALIAATEDSVARGAFGAPTFFLTDDDGEEMFFGKDRLDEMEYEVARRRG